MLSFLFAESMESAKKTYLKVVEKADTTARFGRYATKPALFSPQFLHNCSVRLPSYIHDIYISYPEIYSIIGCSTWFNKKITYFFAPKMLLLGNIWIFVRSKQV